jgi:hypothetical protein
MCARLAVLDVGVLVPLVCPDGSSTSDESGVVGLDVAALNAGRRSDVSDGDGGKGTGGRL